MSSKKPINQRLVIYLALACGAVALVACLLVGFFFSGGSNAPSCLPKRQVEVQGKCVSIDTAKWRLILVYNTNQYLTSENVEAKGGKDKDTPAQEAAEAKVGKLRIEQLAAFLPHSQSEIPVVKIVKNVNQITQADTVYLLLDSKALHAAYLTAQGILVELRDVRGFANGVAQSVPVFLVNGVPLRTHV